jgi:hypothetical protein
LALSKKSVAWITAATIVLGLPTAGLTAFAGFEQVVVSKLQKETSRLELEKARLELAMLRRRQSGFSAPHRREGR